MDNLVSCVLLASRTVVERGFGVEMEQNATGVFLRGVDGGDFASIEVVPQFRRKT